MNPALAADAVMVVHFAFILFVLFGAALLVRWPWLVGLHLPALAWGVWIELSGGVCPLTPLEVELREAAGQAGYSGGFIDRYLTPIIYPDGLTRSTQALFAGILLVVNGLLYVRFLRQRR
ncbi:DUF2784 domain-containing protein [Polymorphobacter multimanifer]|uniref:DUF2784 domain-containing protein n=1 Tax=Polymorphobacter multimanifer TaxID=1070431 RepID=A0A841LCN7_9SPHN|nr:DUF2784 domain-containing protein [Polymorphobacter multimanifer]MBB6226902.1 hypothetical protein [Polymorphobacter multimanifer]